MADQTGIQVHRCSTAEEFLTKLRPQASLFEGGITSTVLYRGVGNSDYDLVPSALRADYSAEKLVNQIKSLDPDNPDWIVDVTVMRLFYQEANRNGLALPYVPQEFHEALAVAALTPDIRGNMFRELLPVFGLAQHYGLPTRLLDWSFDLHVAAYFAARGGTKQLSQPVDELPKEIAVWMVQSNFLGEHVQVVHAPYSGNPNLAAQKGAFTFVYHIHDATPLNVISTNVRQGRNDFHKVTLPLTEAPILLVYLRTIGYDAARLFPGYSGVAESVKELASLVEFPDVEKRMFE